MAPEQPAEAAGLPPWLQHGSEVPNREAAGLPPWLQPQPQPGPAWPMNQAMNPGFWPYGMPVMPHAQSGWQNPPPPPGPLPPGRQLPPGIVPPELLQEWAAMFHPGMQSPLPAPGLGPPDLANVSPWLPAAPPGPGASGASDVASFDRNQLLAARQNAQGSEAGTGRRRPAENRSGPGLTAKPVSDLPPLYDLVSPPGADAPAAPAASNRSTEAPAASKKSASSRSAPQLHKSSLQPSNEAGSMLLQLVNKDFEKAKASEDGITKGAELLAKLRPAKEESKAQPEGQALLGLLRGTVPTPNNKASGVSARGPGKKGTDDGAALLRKLQSPASKQEVTSTRRPKIPPQQQQHHQQDEWWEGHDASWSGSGEAWWAGSKEPQSSRKWQGGKDVEKWHGRA